MLVLLVVIQAIAVSAAKTPSVTAEERPPTDVPNLPHGHLKFHFYLKDPDEKLQRVYLSLQEVQDILLNKREKKIPFVLESKETEEPPLSLLWQDGASGSGVDQTSIDAVLSSVQKVMSSEMSNKHTETHPELHFLGESQSQDILTQSVTESRIEKTQSETESAREGTQSATESTREEIQSATESAREETQSETESTIGETQSFTESAREGTQPATESAREETQSATESAREETQSATESAREETQSETESAREEIQSATESAREETQSATESAREEMQSTTESAREETQSATESTTEGLPQGITIPSSILATLLKDKMSSLETHSPWVTTTYNPILFENETTENKHTLYDTDNTHSTFYADNTQSTTETNELHNTSFTHFSQDTTDNSLYEQNEIINNNQDENSGDGNDETVDTTDGIPLTQSPGYDGHSTDNSQQQSKDEMNPINQEETESKTTTQEIDYNKTEGDETTTLDSFLEDSTRTATLYERLPETTTETWELLKAIVGNEDARPPTYSLISVNHLNNIKKPEQLSAKDTGSAMNSGIPLNAVLQAEPELQPGPEIEPIPEFEPTEQEKVLLDYYDFATSIDDKLGNPSQEESSVYEVDSGLTNNPYEHQQGPNQNENEETPDSKGTSNVLLPSEIALVSVDNLSTLELSGKVNGQHSTFEFDEPQYLEDLPPVDYDYGRPIAQTPSKPSSTAEEYDFPSPDVANSYHQPDHVLAHESTSSQSQSSVTIDQEDPHQFLPAFNPNIAKGENPLRPTPVGNLGLEAHLKEMSPVVREFIDDANTFSIKIYRDLAKIHRRQNMVLCTLNLVSSLSMLTIGARTHTSDILSEILMANDTYTFNPHLEIKKITDELLRLNGDQFTTGIINSLFIDAPRKPYHLEFFSRTLDFFYNARVSEVPSGMMGQESRDYVNAKMRAQTQSSVMNFLKPNADLNVLGPLSVVSGAYFQAKWDVPIGMDDLVDYNFIRFPSAERRLLKTVGLQKRMKIMAGYNPNLDATIAEVPLASKDLSLLLIMPGRQKSFIANGLSTLEQGLTGTTLKALRRTPISHDLILKVPVFSHRNYLNLSSIFANHGLQEIFSDSADFSGINGHKDLKVGDVVQLSEFHSIKLDLRNITTREGKQLKSDTKSLREEVLNRRRGREHSESVAGFTDHQQSESTRNIPQSSSTKQSRKLKTLAFDRAFFYLVQHNPTGLILYIGRYLDPETF